MFVGLFILSVLSVVVPHILHFSCLVHIHLGLLCILNWLIPYHYVMFLSILGIYFVLKSTVYNIAIPAFF